MHLTEVMVSGAFLEVYSVSLIALIAKFALEMAEGVVMVLVEDTVLCLN
jgi:hypothetical protein